MGGGPPHIPKERVSLASRASQSVLTSRWDGSPSVHGIVPLHVPPRISRVSTASTRAATNLSADRQTTCSRHSVPDRGKRRDNRDQSSTFALISTTFILSCQQHTMPPRASPTSALRLRRLYTSRAAVDTPPPVSHSRGAPNGSSASLPPKRKQRSTWTQRLLVLGLIGGGVYAYDKKFNASAITRSLRTGYIG